MKRATVTEELAYGSALDRLTGVSVPAPALEKRAPAPKKRAPASEKRVPARPPATAVIKLSVFLNREEYDYLGKLASTAKFSGGKKLSKTKLIEAMVRAFSGSRLDVRGVKTDEEFLKRVIAQLR